MEIPNPVNPLILKILIQTNNRKALTHRPPFLRTLVLSPYNDLTQIPILLPQDEIHTATEAP